MRLQPYRVTSKWYGINLIGDRSVRWKASTAFLRRDMQRNDSASANLTRTMAQDRQRPRTPVHPRLLTLRDKRDREAMAASEQIVVGADNCTTRKRPITEKTGTTNR
jgi:hypothetical protein